MFPLRDAGGRVLGFGARAMRDNQQPKYVNSPEGPVYRKGRSLFGVDRARQHATKEGRVMVVEGYTDVLALHQAGFRNSVASMGTALTDEQVGELARLAREVVLAFDADASGQEAMLRAQAAAAGRGVILKVARLPDDKDPCDLLAEADPDSFKTIAGDAIPILEFQVTSVLEHAQMHSAADKDRLVAQLAPVLGSVGPSAERDEQVRRVADRLDLREDVLKNLLQDSRQVLTPAARTHSKASPFERSERAFLAMCVSSGERGRESLARLSDDHLSSGLLRQARDWLLEHLDAPTAGLATEDPELARTVGEIVVRASSEPASEHALELAFLQLEQRRLEREIKAAAESSDFDRQRELSVERSRVITRLMGSGEPAPSTTDGRT
jgi:DNA primase